MEEENIKTIKSVAEYIENIIAISSETSEDIKNEIFWYRGESSNKVTNPLTPSGYRDLAKSYDVENIKLTSENIKKIEGNVNAEFFRKGHQYLKELDIKNTYLNRYFIMQHYGIPTRLLDWSDNALVALFFAISSLSKLDQDGVVWVLSPFRLNSFTMGDILESKGRFYKIPTMTNVGDKRKLFNKKKNFRLDEVYRRYLTMDFCNDKADGIKSYYPLAIYPPVIESRIQAQSGCFTIFGNEIKGLFENPNKKEFLNKIIIPKEKKRELLKELTKLGINEGSIYPDLDGLGRYLKGKYANRYEDTFSDLASFMAAYEESKK